MPKHRKNSEKYAPRVRPATSVPSVPSLGVLVGVVIIIVAVSLAYFPSISGGFIMDDDELLTNNSLIKAPDGLFRFWFTTEAPDYWPVTNTTFWIEWRLWGMNSTGYHTTNLILHVIESLLIWSILRKLSIPGAFLAAVIFAVHPVNVESVSWIAQRKNTMAMLFFLLSILCYLKMEITSPNVRNRLNRTAPALAVRSSTITPHFSLLWYLLSLTSFVLAMLSKGSVAVLPVLLMGIVWWKRPLTRRDLASFVLFFVVAVILAGVNVWFQTHSWREEIRSVGFIVRLLGAGSVIWFYLYKALLPVGLAYVYPQWLIQAGNPLWWLPLLTALVVTAVLWRYRASWSRPLLFAWGFFCVALVPVMGLMDVFFMRYSLVADHYQHIAIIGVIALASAGWSSWQDDLRGAAHWLAVFVAIIAVGVLALLTWHQSGLYCNQITLYRDTLEKNPGCWMAHNNLGKALFEAGRPPEAIEQFRQALGLKPDYTEAYNNLGGTLIEIGRPEEAIDYIKQAIRLRPDYPEAYNNMGNMLLKTDRLQEAIEYFKQTLRLKPDFPEAHNNLGVTLALTGQPLEAIEHYEQALRLRPDYIDVHNNLGSALLDTGNLQEAIKHFQQVLQIKPNYPESLYNLANALVQAGRLNEAIEHYEHALRVKPNYPEAYNNLGVADIQIGRLREAIENYKQALRLKPNYAEAHNNLANALIQAGRPEEAIEHCEQALMLKSDYSEAHYNLGNALVKTDRPQLAIIHYEQAIRLNQNYPDAHNNLGLALVRTGRFEEAIKHYQQALKIKPDFATVYFNLAIAHVKMHQTTEAIAMAQKALELSRSQGQTEQAGQIENWLKSH